LWEGRALIKQILPSALSDYDDGHQALGAHGLSMIDQIGAICLVEGIMLSGEEAHG